MLSLAACSREASAANDAAMANERRQWPRDDAMAGNAVAGAAQSVNVADGDGESLGSVAVSEDASGLTLTVTRPACRPGTHGIHLHEKGLCDGPKFDERRRALEPGGQASTAATIPQARTSATSPTSRSTRRARRTASFTVAGAMMASGANMLADADGTSLVVHAKADDYQDRPERQQRRPHRLRGDRRAAAKLLRRLRGSARARPCACVASAASALTGAG